jgi:GT2 family glycosyltransferase
VDLEVLILDDGDIPLDDTDLRGPILDHGYGFRCLHNPGPHGLVHGRILAIQAAAGSVILFLDDDVEVDPDYLVRLADAYVQHPGIVGIGGRDTLGKEKMFLVRAYLRFFLLDSGRVGRLSPSGFNLSMSGWRRAARPFETEFLSGCNMSFRKNAVRDMTPAPWLERYSLGEDIVISEVARAHGALIVEPRLKVKHYDSPVSRVPKTETAYTMIRNTYCLLQLRRSSWWAYPALFWTTFGIILKDVVRPHRIHLVGAYLRALRDVVKDLRARARARRRNGQESPAP